jgi:hypothetical protein
MDLFEIWLFLKMATSEPVSPIVPRALAKHNSTARLVLPMLQYQLRVVLRARLNSGTRRNGEIFREVEDFSSARANAGLQAVEKASLSVIPQHRQTPITRQVCDLGRDCFAHLLCGARHGESRLPSRPARRSRWE